MKIELRRLTLAALVLSTSATYSASLSAQSFVGDTEVDYYGTLGGFAQNSTGSEATVSAAAASVEQKQDVNNQPTDVRQVAATTYIGDDVTPASETSSPSDHADKHSQHLPAIVNSPNPHVGAYTSSSAFCDTCDSGCDTRFGAIGSAIRKEDPTVWMKAEFLMWFPQERSTPPLGVRSAQGTLPILNQTLSPTAVPFGDSFGGDLVPGFRGDIGRYFADGAFGIGGRIWVLGDDEDNLNFGGNGLGESLGVPIFNTNTDPMFFGENAIFIGFNDGDPRNQGSVEVRSALSIVAAEIYGRALLSKSKNHRFELLGGYSHFNIEDRLDINVQAIALPGAQMRVFNDSFNTRNEFHGGQIGSEISLSRGRWTASSLTKVHLGNMSQRINVRGTTAQSLVPNPPVGVANEGLFARGETLALNGFKRDLLSFAPEMNLKLGYQFRDHVNLHVGYTFIYWNDIALAGDQMNRNVFIDTANFNLNTTARHVAPRSSGYFVQGIDLGATIEF